MTRDFYIPKAAMKVADKLSDAVVYLSLNTKGKPRATVFFGKQAKPVADYWYPDEAQREKRVRQLFEARRAYAKRVADRRAESKAFQHTAKLGDIYRTCWGYDQTNVEFFEITELRGKHAILREIQVVAADNGMGSERVVPQSGAYLEPRYEGDKRGLPIRRLIQNGWIKIDDVRTASPWGKRVAGTVIGMPASRTASGWGH
jgi:hypothetical protein